MTDLTVSTASAKKVDVFIPNERMGEFMRKVEHLQKMAVKLALPAWEVAIGPKEWRAVDSFRESGSGAMVCDSVHLEGSLVQITGSAPVIGGWMFIAKIEHEAGGNLIKRMVDGVPSPQSWHTCGPNCDHCKVQRNRNDTFMLTNLETGEFKQVGSSCMQDFLGDMQRDPERIAAMFDYLVQVGRDFDFDPDLVGALNLGDLGVPPEHLMRAVLKIVQEDSGYISAEKGEQLHCLSTGERLRSAFWGSKPIAVTPDAAHLEQAPSVLSWLREQKESESLWLRNIAHLSDRPCITQKNAGLFASGFVAWNRELQRQLRQDKGSGDWVGAVGEKIAAFATLERKAGYENAYGFVSVLSFRDEEGNALVWKTSSPPAGLVVGSSYHLSASVKGHGEFKSDKQTEIIRVKCAELELFAFGALPGFKRAATMASPDQVNESGHSPLLQAVWKDSLEHAKLLLVNGADPNWLNQGSIPILGYATSIDMAKCLVDAGARAVDLKDSELKEMVSDVREFVVSMLPVIEPFESPGSMADVVIVTEGHYFGKVLDVSPDGVVTQKVNRDGLAVRHSLLSLSQPVANGDVVEIFYENGAGTVVGRGISAGVGR